MEVKLLNGQTTKVRLKNRYTKGKSCRSKFQSEVGDQIIEDYPNCVVYQEVHVPGENLFLDFFVPAHNLVVECHGRQHTTHIRFFHKTVKAFHEQQGRDNRKRQWCELNDLRLVELYDE